MKQYKWNPYTLHNEPPNFLSAKQSVTNNPQVQRKNTSLKSNWQNKSMVSPKLHKTLWTISNPFYKSLISLNSTKNILKRQRNNLHHCLLTNFHRHSKSCLNLLLRKLINWKKEYLLWQKKIKSWMMSQQDCWQY